tara:strand:- start:531 stop:2294 length:1764 start_codon:yes stop_codon:yes gene_type:complete
MRTSIGYKNYFRSLQLLSYLSECGVENIILSPGSRSAPLAIASEELVKKGIFKIYNSIDERSAGFHALGISIASDKPVVVLTTSGTAVANLLPSAVEADKSCISVIYITADRPLRLKNCGANQTVDQEKFLIPVCRFTENTCKNGLHLTTKNELNNLREKIKKVCEYNPGPIHLNISMEKPLIISINERRKIINHFSEKYLNRKRWKIQTIIDENRLFDFNVMKNIDLTKNGIIIVGPYRGLNKNLIKFNNSLKNIHDLTGWPVFADPLSGVNLGLKGLIDNWELIIQNKNFQINCEQLLRLGPMPSSNSLEKFLSEFSGEQFLIKENETRILDPLKKSFEYEYGLTHFVNQFLFNKDLNLSKRSLTQLAKELLLEGERINTIIKKHFFKNDIITECSLAYSIPKIWPEKYPIMLSASSPIRDWLTFAGNNALSRRCFSFRGASGIDGTISMALGISRVMNPLLLVTGDLSFLHDINGLLIENSNQLNLTILIIDNNGGNIFNRLYKKDLEYEEIKKLFVTPKSVDFKKLAEANKVIFKDVSSLNELKDLFEWSLSLSEIVILRLEVNNISDIDERKILLNKIYQDL